MSQNYHFGDLGTTFSHGHFQVLPTRIRSGGGGVPSPLKDKPGSTFLAPASKTKAFPGQALGLALENLPNSGDGCFWTLGLKPTISLNNKGGYMAELLYPGKGSPSIIRLSMSNSCNEPPIVW